MNDPRSNWLSRELPDPAQQREYAQERCKVVISETVAYAMEQAHMNCAQVAERLGVTQGHVAKLLRNSHKMTVQTLGALLWACGVEARDLEIASLSELP